MSGIPTRGPVSDETFDAAEAGMNKTIPTDPDNARLADERRQAAQKNLDLALANDSRSATPLEASEAFLGLTMMRSHRGDGIPTQYVHGVEVAEAARTLWKALATALRQQVRAVPGGLEEALAEIPINGSFANGSLADYSDAILAALSTQPPLPDDVKALVRMLQALVCDCELTDGWQDAAPDVRKAATMLDSLSTRLAEQEAEIGRLREALTPSGDTKAAYMGEFSFTVMHAQEDEDGEAIECPVKTYVPWTTIKEIMAAIRARSLAGEGE